MTDCLCLLETTLMSPIQNSVQEAMKIETQLWQNGCLFKFIQKESAEFSYQQLPFWCFLRKIARVHHISGLLGPPAAESWTSWTPGPSETSKQSTALGAWAPSISGKIGYGLLLHYITFTTIETKPPFMLGIFHGELLNNQMVYLK